MPFLVLMVSPFLFLIFGMRIRFFADLIYGDVLCSIEFLPKSSVFCLALPCILRSFCWLHEFVLFRPSLSSSFLVWGPGSLRLCLCFLCLWCYCRFRCVRTFLCDGVAICRCRHFQRFSFFCFSHLCCSCCRCCILCRSLLHLLRFRFFDFLLEVFVYCIKSVFTCSICQFSFFCISFDFSWGRFVVTCFPLCFSWDLELHDTSVVASHVYHVVGLCVFAPVVVFSVSQDVIQLLLYSFRSMIRHLFLLHLLVHCVQCDKILLK